MAPAPQWLTNDFFKDIIKRAIDHEISISDDEIIAYVSKRTLLQRSAPRSLVPRVLVSSILKKINGKRMRSHRHAPPGIVGIIFFNMKKNLKKSQV